MNILSQEARKRQAVVKLARRKGKSYAARMYGVSLSSVKRWDKQYDGKDWRSLKERSHRPHSHPRRHTESEEMIISKAFWKKYERYGWDGVYAEAKENGYTRSLSGMIYAAKRLDLVDKVKRRPPRQHDRRFPEVLTPGEKVQIDVKEVPYYCLRGKLLRENKHLYQWTAIQEMKMTMTMKKTLSLLLCMLMIFSTISIVGAVPSAATETTAAAEEASPVVEIAAAKNSDEEEPAAEPAEEPLAAISAVSRVTIPVRFSTAHPRRLLIPSTPMPVV